MNLRRKDREINETNELLQVIDQCKICRITMQDNEGLYIVPMNFGYIYENKQLVLAPYSMQYTRGWANHKCGKDVRDFAKSKEEFGKLINATSTFGQNTDIEKLVEDNLSFILSSPKESSNPQDYINAHKNEYENFFKYGGEDALQYMPTQFEVGNAEILQRLVDEVEHLKGAIIQ